jgi:hypothetical protein
MRRAILNLGLALLASAAAGGARAATVYYDVYQGMGTTGTLLLGFQVPDVIPQIPPGEAIADVIGSEASFFPAGTDATYVPGESIVIPTGVDSIFQINSSDDIAALGQYSVGFVTNSIVLTRDATLVVSNTAPTLPVPEPPTIALLASGLLGLGLILHRRKAS